MKRASIVLAVATVFLLFLFGAVASAYTVTVTVNENGQISPGSVNGVDGEDKTFVILPDPGYKIDEVFVVDFSGNHTGPVMVQLEEGEEIPPSSYQFKGLVGANSIAATFVPNGYIDPSALGFHNITATAGAGGSISPAGSVAVAAGKDQLFFIKPNPGYQIEALSVYGCDGSGPVSITTELEDEEVVVPNAYMFENVTCDGRAIAATFKKVLADLPPTHIVDAVVMSGDGRISPSGEGMRMKAGTQAFLFLPDPMCTLDSLFVGDTEIQKEQDDESGAWGFPNPLYWNITDDTIITATFTTAPNKYPVTATVVGGVGGTISFPGEKEWSDGTQPTYFFSPEHGYAISQVCFEDSLSDCLTPVPTLSYTFEPITGPAEIYVEYSPVVVMYTITATAGSGGTITPSGIMQVAEEGTSPEYVIAPNPNYELVDVKINGSSQGPIASYTFNNVLYNQTISATFAPMTVTVTASVSGSNGTITYPGAKDWQVGTSPYYTLTPATGYKVDTVLVDTVDETANLVGNKYYFNSIDDDHTIEVSFKVIDEFPINVGITGSGRVTTFDDVLVLDSDDGPSGSVNVQQGGSLTLKFLPDPGFRVGSVSVNNVNKGAITSYTFSGVTTEQALIVNFIADQFTITASAGTGGTISSPGIVSVNRGSTPIYTIAPNQYYRVAGVLVNYSPKPFVPASDGSVIYTFASVQANQKISATFARLTTTVTASVDATGGGTISPVGTRTYSQGTSPYYTVMPAAGKKVLKVEVDGSDVLDPADVTVSGNRYYFMKIDGASHTIKAYFTNL
jgi:hypothetical protein